MQLTQYYRNYTCPGSRIPRNSAGCGACWAVDCCCCCCSGWSCRWFICPKRPRRTEEVPERLARLMVEEKPKPPPPPRGAAQAQAGARSQAEVPKPVDRTADARKKAQQSGLLKFQDELADLRQNLDLTPLGQTKNLQGAVGPGQPRRALADRLQGGHWIGRHHERQRQPRLRHRCRLADRSRHDRREFAYRRGRRQHSVSKGGSGKPSRSEEEIALVFDSQQGRHLRALWPRAA